MPAYYHIRRFQRRDLAGVVRLEKRAFGEEAWPAEDFLDLLDYGDAVFIVARANRQIAGYICGVLEGDVGYIAPDNA